MLFRSKSDNRESMDRLSAQERVLRSKRMGSYKSKQVFFGSSDPSRLHNHPPSQELPLVATPCTAVRCFTGPGASPSATSPVLSRRLATNYQSYAPVTTTLQSPVVVIWRPFRPSRLQLSPAHEQRQFSRLTEPGSVLRHFHEKGRAARLSSGSQRGIL